MKNAEQLINDFKADEGLRKKFHEGLNRLRSDETLSVHEAGIKVAHELGYEVSEDDVKNFIALMQRRKNSGMQLSNDELEGVAGGKGCACQCRPERVAICNCEW